MRAYVWMCLLLLCCALSWFTAQGLPFKFGRVFQSGMVLQMEPKKTYLWGWGEYAAEVSVRLDQEEHNTTIGPGSKWGFALDPRPAGGPHNITVSHLSPSGKMETLELTDVLFGDVWVCAGEGNMELSMANVFNSSYEIEHASTYTLLRLFKSGKVSSDVPHEEVVVAQPWSPPSPQSVPEFSATCLLFGERLADTLDNIPIGLVQITWPDTPIEAWCEAWVLRKCGLHPINGSEPTDDKAIWNGMVRPLTWMAIRGVIWHQGETNVENNAMHYSCIFKSMIDSWRNAFVEGHFTPGGGYWAFPFGFVQLGSSNSSLREGWGRLRIHQTHDEGVAPNAFIDEGFMATSYDLMDGGRVYFRDKQTVATRLANAAKHFLYNETHLTSGPVVSIVNDTIPGVVYLTYDSKIEVKRNTGFSYRLANGEWVDTNITLWSDRTIKVEVKVGANILAYALRANVCAYKESAIYASGAESLPAQPWMWTLDSK